MFDNVPSPKASHMAKLRICVCVWGGGGGGGGLVVKPDSSDPRGCM